MRKDLDTEGPRLGWAVVRERVSGEASVPLPDLPRLEPGSIPGGPAAPGEPYRLVPVSAWSHLPPRRRPASFCPVCLAPVTLKLGSRNRHHYAHAPESSCAAASGEGALHLGAKLLLAEALAPGGDTIGLRQVCARVPGEVARVRCPERPLESRVISWDSIEVERSLSSLRADLMLMRQGSPVLALEVRATHAVDEKKSEALARLSVPWLEVDAQRLLPAEGDSWHLSAPLPVVADGERHPPEWRCEHHAALFAEMEAHRLNGVHRLAWRVVHLYRRDAGIDAGRYRAEAIILSIFERRSGGVAAEAWLQREDRDDLLTNPIRVRTRDEAREHMHYAFLAWARRLRHATGARVDSPMRWTDGPPPSGVEAARLHPQRFRLDSTTGEFVAAPGIPRFAWPLPLFESMSPHPVFGDAPAAWAEGGPAGEHGTVHAVVAPVWITLRHHPWTGEAEIRRVRTDVALHRHDGTAWTEVPDAAFSHAWSAGERDSEPVWRSLALDLARRAAAQEVALARGSMQLQEIARPLLPRSLSSPAPDAPPG